MRGGESSWEKKEKREVWWVFCWENTFTAGGRFSGAFGGRLEARSPERVFGRVVAGEFELSFWLTVILILLILFPHFGLLCTAHQFGLHYMLIFIDSLGHFLGIVVDLAVIFMV